MIESRQVIVIGLLAMTLATFGASAQGAPKATARKAVATPIIAELFNRPQYFTGRLIQVYGLVVEASSGTRRFLLQDVSQMPLAVLAPVGSSVVLDDQVMVVGRMARIGGELVLVGDGLTFVKVLAGGGCC